MDETGQPGGATPRDDGGSAGPRADSAGPTSGWAPGHSAWSNAGAALEPGPDPVLPPWRQPVEPVPARAWSDAPPRYADLLAPLAPLRDAKYAANGSFHDESRPGQSGGVIANTPSSAPPYPYEGDLEDATRDRPIIPGARPAPPDELSGPVSPPEGEANDALESARHALGDSTGPNRRDRDRRPADSYGSEPARVDGQNSDPVSGAGADWASAWPEHPVSPSPYPPLAYEPSEPAYEPGGHRYEPSDHRYEPSDHRYEPSEPAHEPATPAYESVDPEYGSAAPGYDPPRADEPAAPGYEPGAAAVDGHVAPQPATAGATRSREPADAGTSTLYEAASHVLPQRIPAEPDVPAVAEPPAVEPPAETPQLARIATHLRRDDVAPHFRPRTEGFDVNAILAAVRGVPGVRDAALRTTPAGAHSLRLDLHDGSDPAEVSRQVARLLQDRMGLAAAPQNLSASHPTDPPHARSAAAPAHPATFPPLEGGQAGAGGLGNYGAEVPRRRRQAFVHRGRATVEERSPSDAATSVERQPARDTARSAGQDQETAADPGSGPAAPAGTPLPTAAGAATAPETSDTPLPPAETPASPDVASRDPGMASSDDAVTDKATEEPEATVADSPAPVAKPEAPVDQPEAAVTGVSESAGGTAESVGDTGEVSGDAGETADDRPSPVTGSPATGTDTPTTVDTAESAGHLTTGFPTPQPLSADSVAAPRVVLDQVQVSTFGLEATVEVRLSAGEHGATGLATGPAVDGYMLRLCAAAAAAAIDELLRTADTVTDRGRCFIEHAALVPFGTCEVATVVVLLICDGWVEQVAGAAVVDGDQRQAVVRATLAAVNQRLEAVLS